MRAYTFKEHIDRPPRDVWSVLTDLSVAPRWRPLVRSMETEDGQPIHAGTRVRVSLEYFGRRESRLSTTTAFEPERRWTLHSSDNPVIEGYFDFQLEPERTGTRVIASCDLIAHSFLSWLFLPFVARSQRKLRIELLGNLKRYVEGSSR